MISIHELGNQSQKFQKLAQNHIMTIIQRDEYCELKLYTTTMSNQIGQIVVQHIYGYCTQIV